nr:polysaccharide biosynthesis protein [Budvicia sp.]
MFIIHWLFSVPRKQKRIISVVADTAFLLVAYWSALVLRFGSLVVLFEPQYWLLCSVLIPASIACFIKLGLYRAILRYLGAQALMAIAVGVLFSTLW